MSEAEALHGEAAPLDSLHGEYKVPGGKLVVVDLEIADDRIARFRLAGDFFLEPDEALEAIDRSIVGLPSTASAADLAGAVRAAGDSAQEGVWELPLHAPYLESYRSGVAELKNSDMVPAAGSVKAALFLQEFVSGPWAHLDIAGNALKEKAHPFGPAGATGYGAMLLAELVSRS